MNLAFSWWGYTLLSTSCTDQTLYNFIKAFMISSVIATTIYVAEPFCEAYCGDSDSYDPERFILIMSVMYSIVMIVCSSYILSSVSKYKDSSDFDKCFNSKDNVEYFEIMLWVVVGSAIMTFIFSSVRLWNSSHAKNSTARAERELANAERARKRAERERKMTEEAIELAEKTREIERKAEEARRKQQEAISTQEEKAADTERERIKAFRLGQLEEQRRAQEAQQKEALLQLELRKEQQKLREDEERMAREQRAKFEDQVRKERGNLTAKELVEEAKRNKQKQLQSRSKDLKQQVERAIRDARDANNTDLILRLNKLFPNIQNNPDYVISQLKRLNKQPGEELDDGGGGGGGGRWQQDRLRMLGGLGGMRDMRDMRDMGDMGDLDDLDLQVGSDNNSDN